MAEFFEVGKVDQFPENGKMITEVDGLLVAIFQIDGEFYAIEDICTHDGAPLAEEGKFCDATIECPRHGAKFDLRTGEALCMPAIEPIECYKVKIENDTIFVGV